uniref:K Homology domain-containing protein n=2 Tax=Caenorhabditis japonica TaxID=281687 RepID=A0A8R1HHM8_CAEJA
MMIKMDSLATNSPKAMKREHDNDDGDRNGRHKRPKTDGFTEAIQQGKFEVRLLVSSKSAGAIIGKGGENIKRLRAEFNAHVQVPDSNTPERICTMTADEKTVLNIMKDVLPRLEDNFSERDPCELRMLIHQSHAGALIGRNGTKIKELREKCSARLKIFTGCAPGSTDRVLITSGEQKNILAIVEEVMRELKEIPIKGAATPYLPSFNYDPSAISEYGGFPGNMQSGGPPHRSQGPPRGPPGPPRGGGYGGPAPPHNAGSGGPRSFDAGDFQQFRGGPGPVPGYAMAAPGYPPPQQQYGAPSNAGYGYGPGGGGPVTTAQVTIPSDLGGTIIGRGGERIARIRQESGAQITLEQSNGQSERIITIKGTEQQIHSAQYLLQQCVRNSTQGRERFGGSL